MMTTTTLCDTVKQGMPSLYECSPAPIEGVRIRTPFLYPNGRVIDVFVLETDHGYEVTDFSAAVGWLRMQTIRGKLTSTQRTLIDDIGQTLGTEFKKGEIIFRCNDLSEVSEAVQIVGQAAVRVADLWFLFRHSVSESVADDVDEWLKERNIQADRNVRATGRSGRDWRIDFKTSTAENVSLVFVLSTGNRARVRQITEHVAAGCMDLINSPSTDTSTDTLKMVSLFDDTVDVWRAEDYALLEPVSEIACWSAPDEFEHILKTPSPT